MKLTNVALWDRLLRCAVGAAMLALGWAGVVPGLGGAALQLFGWFPLVTGLIGWSPIYSMFGLSTRRAATAGEDDLPATAETGDGGSGRNEDRLKPRGP